MNRLAIGAAIAVFGSLLVCAQEFEVASIKPADPNGRGVMMRGGPGQVNFTGVTLRLLIQQAYGVRDFQISGGPAWMNSDRYEIVAKPPADEPAIPRDPTQATDEQRQTFNKRRQAMLQALLADRFQLKVHRETKEMPTYILTLAKGGAKIKDNGGKTSDPNMRPGMMRMGPGAITAAQTTMPNLIQLLSQLTCRTVVDQTGLTGKYDIDLKYTPDASAMCSPFGGAPPPLPPGAGAGPGPGGQVAVLSGGPGGPGPGGRGPDFTPPDPNGPTIFTALQDQLGLKLESGKGPVEIIVIDHAEKPSEN